MNLAAMKIIVALANLLTFASLSHAFAFTSSGKVTRSPGTVLFASSDSSDNSIPSDRRQFLASSILLLSSASAAAFGGVSPALADVSEGNELPKAAAQFSRVLRAKSDLVAIQKRVSENASDMDKPEWDNVGQFLRKLYSVSDDMKAIAGGLYEPEKKKKSAELIDSLKKVCKAADAPTGTQNGPEFLAYARKLTSIVDEFLELLQDVPDEL